MNSSAAAWKRLAAVGKTSIDRVEGIGKCNFEIVNSHSTRARNPRCEIRSQNYRLSNYAATISQNFSSDGHRVLLIRQLLSGPRFPRDSWGNFVEAAPSKHRVRD